MNIPKPSAQELLEAGVHFGHQSRRWHPKMAKFIHKKHSSIHVIDLFKTLECLDVALNYLYNVASEGKKVIFVGTKDQVKETIEIEAKKSGALYVTERWFGGTLTNFDEIRTNRNKMLDLKKKMEEGYFDKHTKRERLLITREIEKLELNYGGLVGLTEQPGALFVIDPRKEKTAVREANQLNIPVVALIDTNTDPSKIDYPIPGNDDAIKSVALMTRLVATAVSEGYKAFAKAPKAAESTPAPSKNDKFPELNKKSANKKEETAFPELAKDTEKQKKKETEAEEDLVADLKLPSSVLNALKEAKVNKVAALRNMSNKDILDVKGLGEKAVKDINKALK